MANFQIERLKALPQHKNETWQGGPVRMPAWVQEEGKEPFRPWIVVWFSLQTRMLHTSEPISPEERSFASAVDALADFASDQEVAGYRPGKLEVRDSALAEHLDGMLSEVGIEVVHREKLPIFDRMLEDMANSLGEQSEVPGALSVPGVTIEQMNAFAEAAGQFHAAAPWEYLTDEDLIQIGSPCPDASLRCFTVLGAGGQTYGLAFFSSPKQHEAMKKANP